MGEGKVLPMGQTLDEFLGSNYKKDFFDKFLGVVYGAEFINILNLKCD